MLFPEECTTYRIWCTQQVSGKIFIKFAHKKNFYYFEHYYAKPNYFLCMSQCNLLIKTSGISKAVLFIYMETDTFLFVFRKDDVLP